MSDPGQLLAVAQQQAAGDAVGQLQGVVVQEPGQEFPPLVGAGGRTVVTGAGGHAQPVGVAVVGGPGEEVSDVGRGRTGGGEPGVQVARADLVQGGPAGAQPGQEGDGGADPDVRVPGVGAWPGLGRGPVAHLA